MIKAYILINTKVGGTNRIVKELQKIKLQSIAVVAGDFDIIAKVEVENFDELFEVTDSIQAVEGISKTTTQVIEKEISV